MNKDLDRVINSAKKKQSNPNGKNGKTELSFRIQLNLQPELDKGPEFSYLELMQQAKKTQKEFLKSKSFDEEDHEEEENQRIARYFENKYSSNDKMINKNRIRDLHDAGLGYDETDPFVDNSECYDEVVPHSLTTKLGGFYINTGVLEFRQVSDSSTNPDTLPLDDSDSDDDSVIGNYRKNKKPSTLADESDEDFKKGEKSERKRTKSRETEGGKRRKIDSNLKSAKKQSKVRQLVKKAKEQKYNSSTAKKHLKNSLEFLENGSENSQRSLLNNNQQQKSSREGNFLDMMDISGLTAENDPLHSKNIPSFANNNLENKDDMNAFFQSLPGHLKEKVVNLQKVAKNNEKEGKVRFFSPELNKCLLDLELQLQSFHGRSKSSLIQLLTSFVPCSKETLVKRMKRLVTSQQMEILRPAISQLRQAVEKDMVDQMKKYQELCHAQLMAKSDLVNSNTGNNNNTAAANSDNDDNCAFNTNSLNGTNNGEEKTKRTYAPRRKFQWSDTTRALFYRVVQLKLDLFDQTKGKDKITVSEYLKNFFEDELKELWPKLWMQSRTLFKESRKIHQHLTNDKPPKKQQSATGGVFPSTATIIESGKKSNGQQQQQLSVNNDDDMMTPAQLAALLPSINDVRKGKLNKLKTSINKELTVAKVQQVTQHQPKKVAKKMTTTSVTTLRLSSDDTPMPPPPSATTNNNVVQNKVYPSLEELTIKPTSAPVAAYDKPQVPMSKPSFPVLFQHATGETSNHKNLTAAAAAQNLKNKTAEILNKKASGAASELLTTSSSSSINLPAQQLQKQPQKSATQQRQQPNTSSIMKLVNNSNTTTTTSTQQKQQQQPLNSSTVIKTSTPQQPAKKAPAATQKAKHSQQQHQQQQQMNDFSLDLLKLFSTSNLLAPQSTPTQADFAQYAAASQFLSPAAATASGASDPLSANDLTSIANFFMYQNPVSLTPNTAAAKQIGHQPSRSKPTQQQQARKSTEKTSHVVTNQNKFKQQSQASQQAMTPTNKLNTSSSAMASKHTTNSGGTVAKLPQTTSTSPARLPVTTQYKNHAATTGQYSKYQQQHNAAFKDPLPMQLQHKQQQKPQQRKNSSEPSSPSYKRQQQQQKPSPSSSYHSYASHYHPTSSATPNNSYRHHPYHQIPQQAAVSMFPSYQLSPTKPQQQAATSSSSSSSPHHFNPLLHHSPSPSSSSIVHQNRKSADSFTSSYPLPGATVSSPFGDRFAISNFLNLNTNKQPHRLHHGSNSNSNNHHKAESGPK